MYIMCHSAGRGVSGQNIFNIYNLKKKTTFKLTPPPLKLQSIYFLFPTSVSFSLAAGGDSGSHFSHRPAREVGGKKKLGSQYISIYSRRLQV